MTARINDKTSSKPEIAFSHEGLLYLQIQLHRARRDVKPHRHLVEGSS